jgi:penicillin-binding protein 1A
VKKVFRWLLLVFLSVAVLAVATVGVSYVLIAPDLPEVESLRDVQLQVPLRVYSRDRKLIGLFGEMRGSVTPTRCPLT